MSGAGGAWAWPGRHAAARELDAAGIADPALRASYALCRRLNERHGRTYFLATRLLPPSGRPFVHALYGFARSVDDLVDLSPALTPAERADRLQAWGRDFLADLEWGATSDPVSRAVIDTARRWRLPSSYFADFLDAMAMDLTVTEYATYADLERYMWGSSAVIGLQMLPILGRRGDDVRTDVLEQHAIALGMAFQLTNFLRDVAEDLRRGRVYLPQESLREFGVDRERLARGVVDEPIRNLLAWEIERARGLYREAAAGVDLVHPTSQPCLRTALTLYGEILDGIEERDYDVFSGRVAVPAARRLSVGLRGWREARRARQRSAAPAAPATPTASG
ncbi:MAG: phytoene/squalene synthase family protein [Jatrophihabitans sp.]|nr:MAG: phytoene/squalene synthase family protein [Jatrophihabitans sp.]